MAIDAVGRVAGAMIEEVERQFANIPELKAALQKMAANEGKPVEEWRRRIVRFTKQLMVKQSMPVVWPSQQMLPSEMIARAYWVLTPVVIAFGFKAATGG